MPTVADWDGDGRDEAEDDDDDARGPRARRGRRRFNDRSPRNKPPIQEIFKRGSEVLVQVIKEGIGTKGPTLSTYISIPGRYVVLMPALGRIGVSRKIESDEDRRRLAAELHEQSVDFINEMERHFDHLPPERKVVLRRSPGRCRRPGGCR